MFMRPYRLFRFLRRTALSAGFTLSSPVLLPPFKDLVLREPSGASFDSPGGPQ